MLLLALWMAAADLSPPVALIDQWETAQNHGDFAAYENLYGQRFTGVRRSGPRVRRFDRKGWMRDRQRMFSHPMSVEISDIRSTNAGGGGTITFVQKWTAPASGYSDVGRKLIVFVREGSSLRIIREEMLDSKVAGAQRSTADLERFMFVVSGRVVLRTGGGPWATGTLSLLPSSAAWTGGVRTVDESKLPSEAKAWRGRKVRLYDMKGPLCEATISGFEQARRVVPHFTSPDENGNEVHFSDAEIAREAWDEGEDSDLLLGVTNGGPGCKGATWARLQSLPTPDVWSPTRAERPLAQRALREFRKLAGWKTLQTDFLSPDPEEPPHVGRWDEHQNTHPKVMRLGSLVYVSAQAGDDCGDFGGSLWAIWELVGDKLVPRNAPLGNDAIEPAAAVDVDGDGIPEILFDEGLVRRSGDLYGAPDHLEVPYHDCPC